MRGRRPVTITSSPLLCSASASAASPKNRDTYIEKARTWAESNPERARELSRQGQRRYRAKKKAA